MSRGNHFMVPHFDAIYKAFVTSGWQRADLVASARGGDKKKPRDRRGSLTVALKRGPWGDLMPDSTHLEV